MKRIALALTVLGLVLASTPAALATSPHTVDTDLLTPTLNPEFAPYTCVQAGTGITCVGESDESYAREPIGLQCDGLDVYVTGVQRVRIVRWHDLQGRALKTSLQTNFPADRLTLSASGEGPAVVLAGGWHKHYVYPVPGDLGSRILTETGAMLRLRAPGGGLLFQDTGSVTYVPGEEYETPSELHGVHDLFPGLDLDALICLGLT
jgi:hypothetical protein